MNTLGRHLIAELYECDSARLDDVEVVRLAMVEAAELIGATIVGDSFHRFSPQGVSGAVVIAESHLSVHTWPEAGYVAIDIYTCGGLDPKPGFEHIGRVLGGSRYRVQSILRGLPEDVESSQPLGPDDVQILSQEVEVHELDEVPQ